MAHTVQNEWSCAPTPLTELSNNGTGLDSVRKRTGRPSKHVWLGAELVTIEIIRAMWVAVRRQEENKR